MKCKTLIAAMVAAVAVLIPITSASAQPTGQWYWSVETVETLLVDVGIEEYDGSVTPISYAKCFGDGPRWKGMFKRFDCYLESPRFDPFYVTLYVKGKNASTYTFLGWAS